MTDLYANALEQDADDDADVVDSWMLYLRAPALTLDASEVLQSLVQTTRFRGCTIASQSPTCSRQHRDTNVVRNPAPLCDPDILIPDPAIRSPRRLPFSAIVRPPRHRLHRVLERAGCMKVYGRNRPGN